MKDKTLTCYDFRCTPPPWTPSPRPRNLHLPVPCLDQYVTVKIDTTYFHEVLSENTQHFQSGVEGVSAVSIHALQARTDTFRRGPATVGVWRLCRLSRVSVKSTQRTHTKSRWERPSYEARPWPLLGPLDIPVKLQISSTGDYWDRKNIEKLRTLSPHRAPTLRVLAFRPGKISSTGM